MWLGLAATTLLAVLHSVLGDCFFPFEYHGTYAVQTAPNQYSEVLIEINSILPYGFCHKKVDDNLILRDGSNGCLRCFHMAVRSANVLQLHTRDPQSSCATNLNDTYRLCPTAAELSSEEARRRGRVHEIIMYKTKTRTSEEHTAPVYCPISGRFSFTYESESEGAVCPGTSSQLSSNCPYGFGLHLHFRGCSFQKNLNATYQCLADWDDGRGSRYLTLMDVNAAGTGRPRYRCALYREEVGTGRIFLSLSPDGSCHGRLQSATDGPERLVLYAAPSRPWPPAVRRATCTFPEWAHGHWQHAHISGNTIVYKDVANLASYTARCVGGGDDKFVIYTRSHCGEEQYNCIWLKERAVNVMELQLGLSPSPRISNSLCSPHRFEDSGWITQGRQRIVEEASCPVSGEYVGTIPATGGQLCARLSSDCRRPQNMLYTVTSCVDSTDVYEASQPSSGRRGVISRSQPFPSRPAVIPISRDSERSGSHPWQTQGSAGRSRGATPQQHRPNTAGGWGGRREPAADQGRLWEISADQGRRPGTSDGQGSIRKISASQGNVQEISSGQRGRPETFSGQGRRPGTSAGQGSVREAFSGQKGRPETPGTWSGRPEISIGRSGRPGTPSVHVSRSEVAGGWGRPSGQWSGWSRPVGPPGAGRQSTSDRTAAGAERSPARRRWRRDAVRYHVSQPRTTRVSYALPSARDGASTTTSGPAEDAYDPWIYHQEQEEDGGPGEAPGRRDGPTGGQDRRPGQERSTNSARRGESDRRTNGGRADPVGERGSGERRRPTMDRDSGSRDQEPASTPERGGDSNWGTGRQPARYPGPVRKGDTGVTRNTFGSRDGRWKGSQDRDQTSYQTAEDPSGREWAVRDPAVPRNSSVSWSGRRQDQRRPGPERRPGPNLRPGWSPAERDGAPTGYRGSFSGGWPVQPIGPARPTTLPPPPPPRRPALPGFDPTPEPSFVGESRPAATTAAPAPAPATITAKTLTVPPGYREERQYRCLGTWREGDVLYTYTQRLDALTYECFAGRVLPDGRVFIGDASTETGCRRHVDPATSGMLIRRTAPCVGEDGAADDPAPTDRRLRPSTDLERPSVSVTGAPTAAPRPPPTTRRSWRPITARPDRRSSAGHRQVSAPALAALAAALLLLAV